MKKYGSKAKPRTEEQNKAHSEKMKGKKKGIKRNSEDIEKWVKKRKEKKI